MSAFHGTLLTGLIVVILLLGVPGDAYCDSGQQQIRQDNVLLLYNSQSAASSAIKDAYVAVRPQVQVFDLDFSYTTPVDPENPAPTDVTPFEIHPQKFDDLTNPSSPLGIYLAAHPEILAIVTTREIPGLVSTRFEIPAVVSNNQYARSTESLLAALPDFDPGNFPPSATSTGFGDSEESFGEFLKNNPDSPLRYLVSRLDSSGGGGMGSLGQTLALIERSAGLTVNKYAVTGLIDDWDTLAMGPLTGNVGTAMWKLFWTGWCVEYETSCQFLHGPSDPAFCPITDGPFTDEQPTIWLFTSGRHHNNPGQGSPCPVCSPDGQDPCELDCGEADYGGGGYVRHYVPDPAGVFVSQESWNGFSIHRPSVSGGHGQVLHWIAAGGSFGIGHVAEPGPLFSGYVGVILDRLYERGWTWAEAVWSGNIEVNWNRTPIGDPLARVMVYNPDINRDHQVDAADLQILNDAIAEETDGGDINGDGITDQEDLDILNQALGRICLPPNNTPCPSCKNDLNLDGIVDGIDLSLVLANQQDNGGAGDANCNGIVNGADLSQILANWESPRADVNGDDCVDYDDFALVNNLTDLGSTMINILDPEWNPGADTNCDWLTNAEDLWFVANNQGVGCSAMQTSGVGIEIDDEASDSMFFATLVNTTSDPQSIVLKNTGELPGEIGQIIHPEAPFQLTGGTCDEAPFILNPEESCSLEYSFSPASDDMFFDRMQYVRFNAGDTDVVDGPGMTGFGVLVDEPVISIIPNSVDFGEVLVGSDSIPRGFRIRSWGTQDLEVSMISDPGAPFSPVYLPESLSCPPTPFSLMPGEICISYHIFSPQSVDEFDSQVVITTNANPEDTVVTLSGEGVPQ